jgi:Holliday junction resolvase RusA-like endonuclease
MYMPSNYMEWKKEFAFMAHLRGQPKQNGRLSVSIVCAVVPPKSCSKNEYAARIEGGIPSGDVDNYGKSVLDALQDAGLFDDDKQVCKLVVEKKYAAQGGVWVTIERLP